MKRLLTAVCMLGFFSSCLNIPHFHASWDGIVFTQQWPISACIHHEEHQHGGTCNLLPNMTSWSVHGLWPTKTGTRGPNFCNSSWTFDENKIESLLPLLVKYWSNIYKDSSKDSLWEHEWTKHGTCAAEIEAMNSEYKYFSKGLELVQTYDMVSILAMKGIYPNDKKGYSATEIYNAVWNYVRVNPILDCTYNQKTKQHDLTQIKLCLDRSLNLIDCDKLEGSSAKKVAGNCPEKNIIYPSSVITHGFVNRYSESLVRKHIEAWNSRYLPTSSLVGKFIRFLAGTSYVHTESP